MLTIHRFLLLLLRLEELKKKKKDWKNLAHASLSQCDCSLLIFHLILPRNSQLFAICTEQLQFPSHPSTTFYYRKIGILWLPFVFCISLFMARLIREEVSLSPGSWVGQVNTSDIMHILFTKLALTCLAKPLKLLMWNICARCYLWI